VSIVSPVSLSSTAGLLESWPSNGQQTLLTQHGRSGRQSIFISPLANGRTVSNNDDMTITLHRDCSVAPGSITPITGNRTAARILSGRPTNVLQQQRSFRLLRHIKIGQLRAVTLDRFRAFVAVGRGGGLGQPIRNLCRSANSSNDRTTEAPRCGSNTPMCHLLTAELSFSRKGR